MCNINDSSVDDNESNRCPPCIQVENKNCNCERAVYTVESSENTLII